MAKLIRKGGAGSGNFGHAGRPGKVGGSAKNGGDSLQGEFYLEPIDRYPPDMVRSSYIKSRESGGNGDIEHAVRQKLSFYRDFAFKGGDSDAEWKNKVVTELAARTGVNYDVANQFIRQWAQSSNKGGVAQIIQQAVENVFRDKFGTHRSDWQEGLSVPAYDSEIDIDTAETLVRAMYDNTQEFLTKYGIDGFNLFRGERYFQDNSVEDRLDFSIGVPSEPPEYGSTSLIEMNAAESWSLRPLTAAMFTPVSIALQTEGTFDLQPGYANSDENLGAVSSAYIPRERILSLPFTGFGALGEYEAVVLNSSRDDKADVILRYDPRPDKLSDRLQYDRIFSDKMNRSG